MVLNALELGLNINDLKKISIIYLIELIELKAKNLKKLSDKNNNIKEASKKDVDKFF